jgi:hypothetical protein
VKSTLRTALEDWRVSKSLMVNVFRRAILTGRKIWKPIDRGRQTYGRHTDRGRLDAELAVSAVGLDLNPLALLVMLRPSEASQHDGEFLLR